ncbi:MAG: DUF4339 domain-containing protein [bacterium]|nr:DUF4339 domain-containing protein [bacterium]
MIEIQLIIGVIAGIIAACIANAKGRSVVGWFFGGFFLGIIGIVIVSCISNRKDEMRRNQHAGRERRLLREQLHQERLKSQAFQQYANARLTEHDQVLAIDTSSHQSLPNLQVVDPSNLTASRANDALSKLAEATVSSPSPDPAPIPLVPAQAQGPQWFVYIDNKKYGPGATEKVIEMIRSGQINSDTYVWTESMTQPALIRDVPTFTNVL